MRSGAPAGLFDRWLRLFGWRACSIRFRELTAYAIERDLETVTGRCQVVWRKEDRIGTKSIRPLRPQVDQLLHECGHQAAKDVRCGRIRSRVGTFSFRGTLLLHAVIAALGRIR